ncbi:MAG TPA: lipid-A-disaccharide synthase [Pyrinomonadaceae bacterium]|nr:lipid-A-disaccharide synthase [Pyrinomonadaceae bacterium]
MKSLRLMIVAGEASGDAHGASLVNALREATPEINFEFFGATGLRMRAAAVESIVDTDKLSLMGLWEIGTALPKFLDAYRRLKVAATERNPDAVVLIDWPEFNLRLARWLHRRGTRVIYYISPQLWAWRSYRARSIRRDVDLLLSILPFEKEWYASRGITNVEYVGHPLAGNVVAAYDRNEFCRRHNLDPNSPIISLLPGSRHKELARILPPMIDAAANISKQRADIQFVLVIAPNRDPKEAQEIISAHDPPLANLRLIHHGTREALAASDAAAIASGTATLEAALLGTPMVIVYKESPINWHVLGKLINVENYGLVNLIAGRTVVTELMQQDCNGERMAKELLDLLPSERNSSLRGELQRIAGRLGEAGASQRAAEKILSFIQSTTPSS